METMTITVSDIDALTRLDVFVSEQCSVSRSLAQSVIKDGGVKVNGCVCMKSCRLKEGDTVEVKLPPVRELAAAPEDLPVDIVYEDEHLLVVDKPKGMVVHPANGNESGTLVNALLYHCRGRLSSINGVVRPGIVHRIDKDTSGLLIVAKTDEAHNGLAEQIASHSFIRKYEAVCDGNFPEDSGTCDFPIGRSEKDRKKMAVTYKNSREARTDWEVLARYRGYTHLRLTLHTGRTHQIRVHMAHIGHPVTGDAVYGKAKNPFGLQGQCLFARFISFTHPVTGETLAFEAPYPEYFAKTLEKLKSAYSLE
ncbi:MAG: RluA family pseudouridine synthase [Clostridia bacterium]|nr:RluA family pseudouridine synthase [Clostridia bacterium]